MTKPDPRYELKTIAECWSYFREQVLPTNATPQQVQRAEMCFYSGAAFMHDQNLAISERDVTQADALAHLEKLQRELQDYRERLAALLRATADDQVLARAGRPAGRWEPTADDTLAALARRFRADGYDEAEVDALLAEIVALRKLVWSRPQ